MIRVRVGDFRIGKEERKAINDVLDSGRITEGEKVREFERNWADFIGTKYAIVVSSGSSALIAGLTALKHYNIKQGTKIITSPITYIATTNAIVLSGFEPVFVDIDRETFGITPENIRACLEQVKDINKYSLILPVHLMGYPCDMDEINKIASDYGLQIFEDSAQAHGTIYKGRKTGSLSLLSIFSFYVAHNIQAGEMGAIATDNREIARLIKKIKANGRVCDCPVCRRSEGKCPRLTSYKGEDDFDPRFTHDLIGYNFKVMEFQAALGTVQSKKVDWITKKRNENVKYLNEELEGFSNVLKLPKYSKDISYLAYPITILRPEVISRKKLRYELEKKGVETRPLFGCIPTQQPAYSYLKKQYEGKLPNAEYIGKNSFYIGCHQYLEQEDLDFEVEQIKNVINEGSK